MAQPTNKTVQTSRVSNLRIIAFLFAWEACGIPHYCHRLVSFNANEVSDACILWVPILLRSGERVRLISSLPHPPPPPPPATSTASLGQVEFSPEIATGKRSPGEKCLFKRAMVKFICCIFVACKYNVHCHISVTSPFCHQIIATHWKTLASQC